MVLKNLMILLLLVGCSGASYSSIHKSAISDDSLDRVPSGAIEAAKKLSIRIASWNIRKFSSKSRNYLEMKKIARVISKNGFDLIAVQEVFGSYESPLYIDGLQRLVKELEKQTGEQWEYVATHKYGRGYPLKGNLTKSGGEGYAFLWKSEKITKIGPAIIVENAALEDNELPFPLTRVPYTATFKSGRFDFTVATFHATFGRKKYENNKAASKTKVAAVDIRKEVLQLDDVVAAIQAANGLENDVLIMGDFNYNPTKKLTEVVGENGEMTVLNWAEEFARGLNLLDENGNITLEVPGLISLFNDPEKKTTVANKKGSLYDNIWFYPEYTNREYIAGSARHYEFDRDENLFPEFQTEGGKLAPWVRDDGTTSTTPLAVQEISDHRPVYADFRTNYDDDDYKRWNDPTPEDYGVYTPPELTEEEEEDLEETLAAINLEFAEAKVLSELTMIEKILESERKVLAIHEIALSAVNFNLINLKLQEKELQEKELVENGQADAEIADSIAKSIKDLEAEVLDLKSKIKLAKKYVKAVEKEISPWVIKFVTHQKQINDLIFSEDATISYEADLNLVVGEAEARELIETNPFLAPIVEPAQDK